MIPTPEEIRHMEHMHTKMSYNQITDYIYAGNNLCCQTHFDTELLSKGIAADVSLEAERLDNPAGVKYFFWFPWLEDTAPSQELMDLALMTVDNLIAHNIKLYIHCKNGHGRTTTFLASYFIRKNKVSAGEALKLALGKRPSGHLNDIQKAFLVKYGKQFKI